MQAFATSAPSLSEELQPSGGGGGLYLPPVQPAVIKPGTTLIPYSPQILIQGPVVAGTPPPTPSTGARPIEVPQPQLQPQPSTEQTVGPQIELMPAGAVKPAAETAQPVAGASAGITNQQLATAVIAVLAGILVLVLILERDRR